ncbi:ABC transporter substrate-binding protein [Streptomyces sp. NPDC049597]|uniref:ABC transporter substrate-binding protein n=1 Tax=Streptomyces sp. NPDC049597 TaxID=3155276 RepID=UPI00343AC6D5
MNNLTKILIGVGAVTAVVLGVLFGPGILDPDRSCAKGVVKPEGSDECIGVSATGYDFGVKEIREVTRAIAAENRSVEDAEQLTVSVAVMMPFTSRAPEQLTKMRHELQGVYVQQKLANRAEGRPPKIRVLLANTGHLGHHWETVVNQLVTMADGPEQLRAVTGIATSNTANKQAVALLARHHIPMVGSTITADDITNIPGLARVSPTNKDEARALVSHAKSVDRSALLVYDTNPDDRYAQTLREAFNEQLPNQVYEPTQFTSSKEPNNPGNLGNVFNSIAHYICDTEARTVFFAGRHTPLRIFVSELGRAGCASRGFTVLTGDEASYLGSDETMDRRALAVRPGEKKPRVTLKYAALAHPDAWVEAPGRPLPATGGSAAAYRQLSDAIAEMRAEIGPNRLHDGQTIIGYDAMATAVQGIRRATGTSAKAPALTDVTAQWPHLTGSLRVNGASGWICLDNYGNPRNKAVPIVRLAADGTLRFQEFSWPDQKPPPVDCIVRKD